MCRFWTRNFPATMLFHPVGQVCGMSFPAIAPCSPFGMPFALTLYLQSAGKDLTNGLSYELQAHVLEGAMSLAPSNNQDQTTYRVRGQTGKETKQEEG